ncbi:hypothetical protein MNBD_DELTA03-1007, partial [hydrothermal vent metagenome]
MASIMFHNRPPSPKYAPDSDFVKELDREILAFIHQGLDNDDPRGFNRLAVKGVDLQV